MIVVDASVAAKWLIPERGERAAQKLLDGQRRMIAPSLIRLEVAGAVVRCYREDRMTEEAARIALSAWERMLDGGIVHLLPEHELLNAALDLAFQMRHAIADCFYVAAAKSVNTELITADKTLHKRAEKHLSRITLLHDGVGTDG